MDIESSRGSLTRCVDGYLRIFDIRKGEITKDYYKEPIVSLDIGKDDSTLILGSLGFGIRLIDSNSGRKLIKGEVLNEYKDHKNQEYLIRSCFSFNNTHILSGSEDNRLYIYNILEVSNFLNNKKKKCESKIGGFEGAVSCVDYSPTKDTFAFGSYDGSFKVYDKIKGF